MAKFNLGEEAFEVTRKMSKKKVESEKVAEKVVNDATIDSHGEKDKSIVEEEKAVKTAVNGLQSTRGRKGMKLPTMNMRFTPDNYEYMRRESAVRGMSTTAFVNWLIESYRSNPAHVNYTDDFQQNADW